MSIWEGIVAILVASIVGQVIIKVSAIRALKSIDEGDNDE